MAKTKRKAKLQPRFDGVTPPIEQAAAFAESWEVVEGRRARTFRRIPVIVTLANAGKLDRRQYNALDRYRDVVTAATQSPLRSGLDFSPRGGGEGLPHFGVRINRELEMLNEALGANLQPTAYAIAFDDMTPSEWAIELYGSVMRERKSKSGLWTVIFPEPRRGALRIVQKAICQAGDKLADAIGA